MDAAATHTRRHENQKYNRGARPVARSERKAWGCILRDLGSWHVIIVYWRRGKVHMKDFFSDFVNCERRFASESWCEHEDSA